MSAFGAYPAVLEHVQSARRGDPVFEPPRLSRLGWVCFAQLALFLLLEILVHFPALLANAF